ncbi:hypothetical protein F3Y22_tig00110443pilonHSYRG00031 [Hibiscus syriacus]|uniref:Uncharacterized protein n=1 Tax=Hibiscus syriacus TaxID=106335 RepID=A0A6A3ANC4_HIBSY|nr:uncharacterized protein LOC120125754 [Hibiscus syriacus]KAE8704745.1 hypothetical protein F3Y22_tig00110443pilonHSYRG00031 [Hibiscus syriacus]
MKMEKAFVTGRKDNGENGDSSLHRDILGDNGMDYSELKLKKLVRKVNPWHALILSVKRLQDGKSLIKESFQRSISGISSKIPRHVVTLDEKYLRCCLDLIHINAAKAAHCNISVNLSSLNTGILADGLDSTKIPDEGACDFGRFVFDCPLEVETGSVVIGPVDPWVVGSIMGSKSMANILQSPLLKKFGVLDVDPSLNDVKGSTISYDFTSSPGGFMNYSSNKLGSEARVSNTCKYGSETVQKRLVSLSSSNSTCSDQSFSCTSSKVLQGMLHCTWKGGIPYFVFSLDNQREVYVANLLKEGSARNKGLGYTYLFRSSKGSRMEDGITENELHLVGKMKVSTSFSIVPRDSNIMETEFVLFGGNGTFSPDLQTLSHNHRKNKGLTSKVSQVFKSGPLSKQRTMSRFRRSVSLIEGSSFDPCHDTINNSDALDGTDLLEEQLPSNSELIAIVSRDHFPKNTHSEVGGWGLNFLGKTGVKQKVDPSETPVRSACSRDTGDCSRSMNILVPAGIHGGPRTRNGGPSSLIERWRSGGHCDCGGWDLGCPLTVLKARSSKGGGSSPSEASVACKLFDFFIQGSEHGSPTLTISNVHDGLYFIHFQPTLSALQSFSAAVAYIHTQSPTLRPKNVQQSR